MTCYLYLYLTRSELLAVLHGKAYALTSCIRYLFSINDGLSQIVISILDICC